MKNAYSYIRFSSVRQAQGDSLRRQTEEAAKWAKENGYVIKELSFRDLGVSAYSGANVKNGGLGQFLEAIKVGKVKAGESLIIESLDRLSRDEVLIALGVFGQILQAGVNIITWSDRRIYTSENISDIGNIMYSIMIMCRAHEESLMKSKRAAATWAKRRKDAAEKGTPLSKHCPAWLRVKDGRYEHIPERVRIVNMIFEMSYFGRMGGYSIARRLNELKVDSFTGKPWTDYSIFNILHNPAVCGEYTPRTYSYKNGKRVVKELPTIYDYYPEVIFAEGFYEIQLELKKRRIVKESGRTGNGRNVFRHIVKCAHCGANIRYRNKTRATYLSADNRGRENNCTCYLYWRYPDFEKRVLDAIIDYQENSGLQYRNDMINRARALLDANYELDVKLTKIKKERTTLITLSEQFQLPELNQKLLDANAEIEKMETTRSENMKLINEASKFAGYESTIDKTLDAQKDDERATLVDSIRNMVVYIAADMKEKKAVIHLRNTATIDV